MQVLYLSLPTLSLFLPHKYTLDEPEETMLYNWQAVKEYEGKGRICIEMEQYGFSLSYTSHLLHFKKLKEYAKCDVWEQKENHIPLAVL